MVQETDLQPPIRRPRRRWIRPVLFGLVILVCGMVIGSGLTLHLLWRGFTAAINQPSILTDRVTKRMQRKLDLTDEQTQAVRDIFNRYKLEFRDLHQDIRPRVETILKSLRRDVSKVLTPEQAKRWQEGFDDRFKRWGRIYDKHLKKHRLDPEEPSPAEETGQKP